MKISQSTIQIFENFSKINQNLLIRQGSKISSFAVSGEIFGLASLEDEFPVEFPIYNLNEFLGVLSMFESPEIEFSDDGKTAVISSGDYSVRYNAADKDHIHYQEKDPKAITPDVSIDLTQQQIQSIIKAASTLKAQDLSFVSDGKVIEVVVTDRDTPNSNSFRIKIGEGDGKVYTFNIKVKKINLLQGDYLIEITRRNVSCWTRKNGQVRYYMGFEKDSEFSEE